MSAWIFSTCLFLIKSVWTRQQDARRGLHRTHKPCIPRAPYAHQREWVGTPSLGPDAVIVGLRVDATAEVGDAYVGRTTFFSRLGDESGREVVKWKSRAVSNLVDPPRRTPQQTSVGTKYEVQIDCALAIQTARWQCCVAGRLVETGAGKHVEYFLLSTLR